MCMLVITLLFHVYRFPGKKTQDIDVESKFVTAAKRSRKETTVEEILGESFIKRLTIIKSPAGVGFGVTSWLVRRTPDQHFTLAVPLSTQVLVRCKQIFSIYQRVGQVEVSSSLAGWLNSPSLSTFYIHTLLPAA